MKSCLIAILSVLLIVLAPCMEAAAGDATAELEALAGKIKAKANAGKLAETDYTDELKQFDALLEEHKGEKTEPVAKILFFKAQLYFQVFNNTDMASELVKQLKSGFPDTELGSHSDEILAEFAHQAEVNKIKMTLVAGKPFPDFNETDLDGKPLSVANYKGKVVLVDFWATWCGPCIQEMPNIISAYKKYHDKGFEIIGVSLDEDKDNLLSVLKEKGMVWPQYFDGEGPKNKLGQKYGIDSIPANFLIGKDGNIIGTGLWAEALDAAVAKAVGN